MRPGRRAVTTRAVQGSRRTPQARIATKQREDPNIGDRWCIEYIPHCFEGILATGCFAGAGAGVAGDSDDASEVLCVQRGRQPE
jgi:hypothetical protein